VNVLGEAHKAAGRSSDWDMIEEEGTVADWIEEGIAVDCAEEDTAAGLAVGWNIAGEEDIAG